MSLVTFYIFLLVNKWHESSEIINTTNLSCVRHSRLSVPQTGLNGAFLGANFQLQINTYLLLGCVFKAAGE